MTSRTVVNDSGMLMALLRTKPPAVVLKKRPDAVDALVVVTAALHGAAQILTSDPDDIRAYAATLDHADISIETV